MVLPALAAVVADERLNACPVYFFGYSNFKNSAISLGIPPILLIPAGVFMHFPYLKPRKKFLNSVFAGRKD